ncbi:MULTISPECIES: DNA-binding protein [Arthrobacter]|uniref:DNA-binding protein n=1 Tax=Arthrobacter TaxID=1663 RepID=UPI0006DB2995|nr:MULTISPECIES: DNA-binding protein [unclassified Arthrobacter]KPN21671.1 DNA-binding protein [Arthrobacter sp. Edens01]MSR99542.1 DNA-binding protein [Arthrobacter sp. BL-252-APC-1A]
MSTSLNELPRIGAPASRGLGAAGFTTLRQLAGIPREDLAKLHGVGPKALNIIEAALNEYGLGLKE